VNTWSVFEHAAWAWRLPGLSAGRLGDFAAVQRVAITTRNAYSQAGTLCVIEANFPGRLTPRQPSPLPLVGGRC
jgi:hypothetical protein